MKIIKKVLKNNSIFALGLIIGVIAVTTAVKANSSMSSAYVIYSGTDNNITADRAKGALDQLWSTADVRSKGNFVSAYTYDESSCVTGREKACVRTECYKIKSIGSCPKGTIINYKVNDTDIVTFHVIYNDAKSITMQSQRNIVYNTMWIAKGDYIDAGGSATNYDTLGDNSIGPLTVLNALENATAGWTNVDTQTYDIGTALTEDTGCSAYNNCSKITYTITGRKAKARMITVQEAAQLGCKETYQSCPKWMYNYLSNSTSYGGTENDTSHGITGNSNSGYWTMSSYSENQFWAWYIWYFGDLYRSNFGYRVNSSNLNEVISRSSDGARAVVVVSK